MPKQGWLLALLVRLEMTFCSLFLQLRPLVPSSLLGCFLVQMVKLKKNEWFSWPETARLVKRFIATMKVE